MTTVGSYIIGLGSTLFLYQFCAGLASEHKFKIKTLSFTHIYWVTTRAHIQIFLVTVLQVRDLHPPNLFMYDTAHVLSVKAECGCCNNHYTVI